MDGPLTKQYIQYHIHSGIKSNLNFKTYPIFVGQGHCLKDDSLVQNKDKANQNYV